MIKNWNKFIKEGVEYDYIKKKLEYIIETPDSEYENGSKGKESDLISIFRNDLKLEDNDHITRALNIYTEYVYNDESKEIRKFLTDTFSKNISKWSDIREYITVFMNKSFEESSKIILNLLDLYNKIKDDFKNDGYPKKSDLSKNVESICLNSLDDSILEFFDVVESHLNLYIELGYDKDNLNLELLQKITDEIYSVCGRIKDSTKLRNTSIEFGDYLWLYFEF